MPYFGAEPSSELANLDINGQKLILDADADTSITADTDDQIDIEVSGSDELKITTAMFAPASADGSALGGTSNEWSDLYLADGGVIYFGNDQDVTLTHDPDDGLLLNEALAVGDGTSSLPSLTNVGDLHTGLFFPSNDQMGFSTGGTERHRFNGAQVHFNDTENANLSAGLSINQAGNDNHIIALKSSDIAHGVTDYAETDTYMYLSKWNATTGGGAVYGIGEDNTGLTLVGLYPNSEATKTASAGAPIRLDAKKKSGTGAGAPSSNDNLLAIYGDGSAKFVLDYEGDIYHDSNVVSEYDEFEDAHLVRSLALSRDEKRGVIESKFDKFISYNHESLANLGLVGREHDGTPNYFVNLTGMSRLHNGAIWQQYEKHENLLNAVYELAVEAVGEDKANQILDKNDIKLLSKNELLN